ncbi:hypothetical protein [Xanthomonas arboricola]|uniref:hypothetical protein n=1 Tax=Xanthomonas arboricola TaxID=56448 RepID=UPI001430C830|nr:hypothetical protein [Xanthomonas arboricola]NJB80048.1 hypothetical protein [Xanthomonas arboricola]
MRFPFHQTGEWLDLLIQLGYCHSADSVCCIGWLENIGAPGATMKMHRFIP